MEDINWKAIKYGVIGLLLLLGLILINPFNVNDSGYRTYVQTINGNEWVQFEPGLYFEGFLSRSETYPDVITIQYEEDKDRKDNISFFSDLITSQFQDGTYAQIGFTVKWELPDQEKAMIKIHKDYRSARRLAASLADYSKECMNYSTPRMDSEEHYSGGKSRLKDDFQYQLRNGQYILDQHEEIEYSADSLVAKRKYVATPRQNPDGSYVLSKSDIQEYEITPNFVAITHVDYDTLVDSKLKKKVELSTQESISKQALITAQQDALTEEAKGQQLLASTRATELAAKEKAVIQKEKEVELARLAAQQAAYDAKKVEADGMAKAAANRALVNAGLTPIERANIEKETAIGVAAELAKITWPEIIIYGGSGSNAVDPMQALGLQSIYDLQKKMSASKGN